MKTDGIIMLYSGGADSRLMLELGLQTKKLIHCVLFDYGQKHIEELEFAKEQLTKKSISFQSIKLSGYDVVSALTGDGEKGKYEGVSIYNVPARNTIFLSVAAGVAESKGYNEVWIGCDMSDFYGQFPDCKQEYIGKVNDLFEIAFSYPIKVVAPLLGMEKDLILNILEKYYKVDIQKIYSGYREFA